MQQQEILKYIKKHQVTGIIDDALIPFFDQDGRWRGDQIRWKADTLSCKLTAIQKAFLPFSRRTRKTRYGTVLRTSLYWRGDETLKIHYTQVEGSIIITNNAHLHANELYSAAGHFITNSSHRLHLPNLTVVGGKFEAMHCLELSAPQLRHVGGNVAIAGNVPVALETVGGSLGVYWSFCLEAPRLRQVGRYFIAYRCTKLVAPVLEEVGGSLLVVRANGKIDAPKLCAVGGDFLAANASLIRTPALRSVFGDLDTHSARDFYHPEITVRGQWTGYPDAREIWIRRTAARLALRGDTGPFYL